MPKIANDGRPSSHEGRPEPYMIGTPGDTYGAEGLDVQRVEPTPDNPYIDIRTGNAEYDATLREACLRWLAARNAE